MKLSIIIPAYNAESTIRKCISSIFQANNRHTDEFEVIVVNDCSTDNTASEVMKYSDITPPLLLKLVNLPINSRQGTARNVGVESARGKYIQFLDADDYLVDGAITALLDAIDGHECDMIMFDSMTLTEDGKRTSFMHYSKNPQNLMSGQEYLTHAEVPWVPWLSLIKRAFWKEKHLKFAERVRFEDTDFMLKAYLLAETIIYLPICAVCHVINPNSTVNIGCDYHKIKEQFMTEERLAETISHYSTSHPVGVKAVIGHYDYLYDALLKKTLWRLKYRQIKEILNAYPYSGNRKKFPKMASCMPDLYASVACIVRPILLTLLKLKKQLKR